MSNDRTGPKGLVRALWLSGKASSVCLLGSQVPNVKSCSAESRAGAVLFEKKIPVSRSAKGVKRALTDVEDFELLFTLPPEQARRLSAAKRPKGLAPMSAIGWITQRASGVQLVGRDGKWRPLKEEGFDHFK